MCFRDAFKRCGRGTWCLSKTGRYASVICRLSERQALAPSPCWIPGKKAAWLGKFLRMERGPDEARDRRFIGDWGLGETGDRRLQTADPLLDGGLWAQYGRGAGVIMACGVNQQ